jgi:hypothetical protein
MHFFCPCGPKADQVPLLLQVVLFTAGLEDYAKPICDALQAKYNCFLHRLYRPACVPDEVYPCVKVGAAACWPAPTALSAPKCLQAWKIGVLQQPT